MKMLTLADEIVLALPKLILKHPDGVSLIAISRDLGVEIGHVRIAAKEINAQARADLMRRPDSREQFIVPFRYRKAIGLRYCAHCFGTFSLPPPSHTEIGTHYSNRRCCNRSCGIAWSWTRPGVRTKRAKAIAHTKNTPEAMAILAAHNKRRWSKPEEHTKLSEQNRREWADPVKKVLRSQAIAAVNGSPEMRAFYSNLRKDWWKNPKMRAKMIEAARKAKRTPEYRAYFSELTRMRWQDPAWRKKWLPAVRRNSEKAVTAITGKKQPASQVARRVASRRENQKRRAEA